MISVSRRQQIRAEILRVLESQHAPMELPKIASEIRKKPKLKDLDDLDVLHIVQPMIVVGELQYTPGLNIALPTSSK
ncbi:MAG: hypothetical protein K2X35_21670 [Bryobacteraceae bacterium]|nr:hypothetical protein [Bryobacteraceae bacterium]